MAREKTNKVIFTFHSTTQAIMMEERCKKAGAAGRLIPVPRRISAGCCMAWAAEAAERDSIEKLVKQEGIEVEGIHELLL